MPRHIDINERVAVLETEMDDMKNAHVAIKNAQSEMSKKLDDLSKHLLMLGCILAGLIVGSKLISIDELEKIKSVFGL